VKAVYRAKGRTDEKLRRKEKGNGEDSRETGEDQYRTGK
jgi:hypothetical protein